MKKMLMGNEAMALGALRAGVRVATGYPGTPSTEVLETIAKQKAKGCTDAYVEWSVNEKSALEVAAGASYAGARTLVTMKQVGLNVASDPLMSLAYVGVKGGMVGAGWGVELAPAGEAVAKLWREVHARDPFLTASNFVLMPDHAHLPRDRVDRIARPFAGEGAGRLCERLPLGHLSEAVISIPPQN